MKKKTTVAVTTVAISCALLFCLGAAAFGLFLHGQNRGQKISRTFMIYIVGSDLESQYGAATRSIKQILDSGIDLTKNNVLIRTGGTNKWKSKILSNKTMTYQVTAEGLKAVKEEPVQDMASKNTLSSFLTYCYRNYKTKSYDLILWDHGGGPTMGYGYDEVSKNVMSLSELDAALNGSPFRSGNKLEMVGFDACLMSSVEVAFLLSDNSDYLVASQETIPGWGGYVRKVL